MSFFILLTFFIRILLATANQCATYSTCNECVVIQDCTYVEDFENKLVCVSQSDIHYHEIKTVPHTIDLCGEIDSTTKQATEEITESSNRIDVETTAKSVETRTLPRVEYLSASDEIMQPSVEPRATTPMEESDLQKDVQETSAGSTQASAIVSTEEPEKASPAPTTATPYLQPEVNDSTNESSNDYSTTEIPSKGNLTSPHPQTRSKEIYCPKDNKESKGDRLGRSLCRSFKLLKRQIKLDVKYRHMDKWNREDPYAHRPHECRLLQWKRINCRA